VIGAQPAGISPAEGAAAGMVTGRSSGLRHNFSSRVCPYNSDV
jgi:hypothetical protein